MHEAVCSLKETIKFFGYVSKEIQTDNGFEFTDKARRNEKTSTSRQYPSLMENFCVKNQIKHHLIRPRTPQHNEKVERSYKIDQKNFIIV